MQELFALGSLAALATLAILEIVLGIDNVVFLAILTGKLPEEQQPRARTLGLGLAAVGRIALLFAISWVITLDQTKLFELPFAMPGAQHTAEKDLAQNTIHETTPISVKDVVLLLGGLFLLGKSTWEIGHQLEPKHEASGAKPHSSLTAVLVQIVL